MFLNHLIFLFKPQKDNSVVISRFFRKIFESKYIRLFLGIYLAVSTLMMGVLSTPIIAFNHQEAVLTYPQENSIYTETAFKQPVLGSISQGYHWYHPAIDITNKIGTPIYPITKGKVKEISFDRWGYGNKIIIDHGDGLWSLYAHLEEIKVKPNQEVDKDTLIATLGLTGWTTGPHLHLEIWQDNQSLNPITVLPDFT